MSPFLRKYFLVIVPLLLIFATLFVCNFLIVANQNERDASGGNVRRMEFRIAELKKEIRNNEAYRDKISNATVLRNNRKVQDAFRDVSDAQVIRVRVVRVPYGRNRVEVSDNPHASAVGLAMLTSPYATENYEDAKRR